MSAKNSLVIETSDVDDAAGVFDEDIDVEVDEVAAESDDADGDSQSQLDPDDEAPDEPASASGAKARSGAVFRLRRPTRTGVFVAACALFSAVLAALGVAMFVEHREMVGEQRTSSEFSTAAEQVVVDLLSVSAADAEAGVQRVLDRSTGAFRDEFAAGAEEFVTLAQEAGVATAVTVQATAVESKTAESAVVLVAASSTMTNAAGADEQPRHWRLSLNMVREGGQIKMASLEFVP